MTSAYAKTPQVHGMIGSPTYNSWSNMIQRCLNPNHPSYPNYGGRGIKVYRKWKIFVNFLTDMGVRPKGTTLERENNSLSYSPYNCVWATWHDQSRNRRGNVQITAFGKTQCIRDWANELQIPPNTISDRLARGCKPLQALSIQRWGKRP